jgi:tetratricopeptide (TPR) repeat protein
MDLYYDSRGLRVTASNNLSVERLDGAVTRYLGARRDTLDWTRALATDDPDCILAQCLLGYIYLHAGKPECVARAREIAAATKQRADARAASAREKLHVGAVSSWAEGDFEGAVARWEATLRAHPLDLLALRLAQFMTSYLGKSVGIRDSIARVFPAWEESVPGYGFVLGCYAYGFEEAGDYASAEAFGRRAIEKNSTDLWAAHAVTHVMEMDGRPSDGISWICGMQEQWRECNNFVAHLWWHQCLFFLALGQYEQVLNVYDTKVREEKRDEYLDIANSASVLWRLEQAGVNVGERWNELATFSAKHIEDHIFVFADLHYGMAMAAGCDPAVVERHLGSCEKFAEAEGGTESRVMVEVGLAIAKAIAAHRRGDYLSASDMLFPVRSEIWKVGGSHAQRDLFEQLLIDSTMRSRRNERAKQLLSERTARRPHDIWSWKNLGNVLEACGEAEAAVEARSKFAKLIGQDRQEMSS